MEFGRPHSKMARGKIYIDVKYLQEISQTLVPRFVPTLVADFVVGNMAAGQVSLLQDLAAALERIALLHGYDPTGHLGRAPIVEDCIVEQH